MAMPEVEEHQLRRLISLDDFMGFSAALKEGEYWLQKVYDVYQGTPSGEKEAIPRDVLAIIERKTVTIQNCKFGMYLKPVRDADRDSDWAVYGGDVYRGLEGGDTRFHWTIIRDGDRFAFHNVNKNSRLKVTWDCDRDGDRRAYVGATCSRAEFRQARFYWRIKHVEDCIYEISNYDDGRHLKVQWSADGDGDRAAYAGRKEVSNITRFLWIINPV